MPDIPIALQAALAGRYELERELGRGGMAVVYLARDVKHDRPVALKVLQPTVAAALGAERFLREIGVAAGLQHPHILTVFDSGDAAGTLWFTMPFVDGRTLRERLDGGGPIPLSDALRITTEAARALDFAHARGVLHRDVKPENLLLTADGTTLVADFGIARAADATSGMTETGIVLGTPAYMSPEQASGARGIDARSDVYALACVLFEMLTGEPPYTGRTPQALLAKRLTEPAPRVATVRDVPPAVDAAIARALARSPADRFASAGEFARALVAPAASAPGRPRRAVAIVAVLLLLVVAGVLLVRRLRPPVGVDGTAASAAVLPFVDLAGNTDQEYFSDGLTDELISALGQIPGLHVAARTSSFQFKGQEIDVRDVGRRLGVGSVLEGTVRRSADRVRITVRLVDARNGYQLWTDSYDRDLADIFAVQEDIARAVANALRVRLAAGSGGIDAARRTEDIEAYDFYLKGRFAWNQRTADGMREAVRFLEAAVARDSAFALAWAALADAYVLVIPYAGAPRDSVWPLARAAANRALVLDPALGEAHTALAYGTMIYDWDWPAAEASFRRAIDVAPQYATGYQWYGDFLWSRGRLDEALDRMQEAQRLDPLSRVISTEVGQTYYLMGRPADAERQIGEVLALDPAYSHAIYILGLVRLQQERPADAVELLRRALEMSGFQEDLAGGLAYAYATAGDTLAARAYTAELLQRREAGGVGPFALALAYAGQGDPDRAFAYLHEAIEVRDAFLPEDFFDPMLDGLRADPRFREIERRMGVVSPAPVRALPTTSR